MMKARIPTGFWWVLLAVPGCNAVLGIDPPAAVDGGDAASTDGGSDTALPDAGTDASGACTLPSLGPCKVLPQSGCSGDENCEITSLAGLASCTAATATPVYGNCTSYGQCPKGTECIGQACKPFCCDGNDCLGGVRTCEQITNGSMDVPGLRVCSAGCDPINPSTICGPGVACYPQPWNGKGVDHGDCFGGAGTDIGPGSCTLNSCAPGYYCQKTGECAKWCRLAIASDCTGGKTCTVFDPIAVIGGVQYGTCM